MTATTDNTSAPTSPDFFDTDAVTKEERLGADRRAILKSMEESAAATEKFRNEPTKPFTVTLPNGTTIQRR